MPAGIPPTLDSDAEDVVWALQTADALWKRGERVDAIVWLRRAAQSAGDVQQDDRALELARGAAELSDLIAQQPAPIPSNIAPMSEAPAAGVDDLLADSAVDIVIDSSDLVDAPPSNPPQIQVGTAPMAFRPPGLPSIPQPPIEQPPPTPTAPAPPVAALSFEPEVPPAPAPPPEPPPVRPPSVSAPPPLPSTSPPPAPVTEAPPSPLVLSSVSSPPAGEVRTAAEAHAGMLDPWANAEPPPLPKISSPKISEQSDDDDDEVVTSVKELQPKSKQPPPVVEVKPPPLPEKKPAPVIVESTLPTESSLPIVAPFVAEDVRPTPRVPVPPPEPTLVSAGSPEKAPVIDESKTDVDHAPVAEKVAEPPKAKVTEAIAKAVAPKVEPPKVEAPKTEAPPEAPKAEAPKAEAPANPLAAELEGIEAFGDVPDDTRGELAAAATLHTLSKDEEVTGFSLAVVLEGEVDVAAVIVDVPAERLTKGRVLKPTGSLKESVPLRLICATASARVAVWEDKDIQATFKACPWVEDDLRAHADRVIALVGVTMGPLADRLDESIRAQITGRLTVREVPEGEELVAKGAPVRELVIVGQGVIELIDDGVAVGSVGTGEILFGSEVVGGGKATATARAGKGGTLVLAVERGVAQELMMTLPPLLEVLAGM